MRVFMHTKRLSAAKALLPKVMDAGDLAKHTLD